MKNPMPRDGNQIYWSSSKENNLKKQPNGKKEALDMEEERGTASFILSDGGQPEAF
jgi:hypothetical protein